MKTYAVTGRHIYGIVIFQRYGITKVSGVVFEKSIGGDWLRPDDGRASCMSRTPVGLVKNPVPNFNWQLSVANGCLDQAGPSSLALPVS